MCCKTCFHKKFYKKSQKHSTNYLIVIICQALNRFRLYSLPETGIHVTMYVLLITTLGEGCF